MAPKYKITYFEGAGSAEHIRYILGFANQEFENVTIKYDVWPDLKPNTPFGKLPILEIDGKPISQSNAIARYLARQFGLTGKDEWEALQCDTLVDSFADLRQIAYSMYYEKDLQKIQEIQKHLEEKEIPYYFTKFEKLVDDNSTGYLVGNQITWADLNFAANLKNLVEESKVNDILKPYPGLKRLVDTIHEIPGIKAWLDRRPPNPPLFGNSNN